MLFEVFSKQAKCEVALSSVIPWLHIHPGMTNASWFPGYFGVQFVAASCAGKCESFQIFLLNV